MSSDSSHNNLWQATAPEALKTTNLVDGKRYDVVVIGGGFTGVNSALRLAEDKVSVALLDANCIGHGGSGRNVGLVNAGLWTEPETIEASLGIEAGQKLNTMLVEGPDIVFSIINAHQINCEATRNGTLHCAHSIRGLKDLENRHRQHQSRRMNVDLISRTETEEKTGTSAYHGALFHKDVGTIQPLAYLRGIARIAIELGVEIYQNSPVTSLLYENKTWNLVVGNSTISADAVIVATNAYNQNIGTLGKNGFTPIHYFQAATQPLSDDLLKTILPERQGCWDTAMIMSSIRLDNAGRLIIGSVGSLKAPIAKWIHNRWCHSKLEELFPQLGDVELEYSWHGRIAYTKNHLPKVVNFGSKAIKVFGYNGRGISPGTVFGRSAATYILTGDLNTLPIQPVCSYDENFTSLKRAYYEFGVTAMHGIETLL